MNLLIQTAVTMLFIAAISDYTVGSWQRGNVIKFYSAQSLHKHRCFCNNPGPREGQFFAKGTMVGHGAETADGDCVPLWTYRTALRCIRAKRIIFLVLNL